MKGFRFRQTGLWIVTQWIVIGGLFISAAPPQAPVNLAQVRTGADPASLAAELRNLQSSLSYKTDARVLPQTWEVETPGRRYSISTGPLQAILASGRGSRVEEAKAWLDRLAAQLEEFGAEPSRSTSGDRAKLDRILARSEFGGAGPPSALGRLRDRVRAWVLDLLEKLFGYAASHPATSHILFWILLAGTVGFLALWVVRLWSQEAQMLKLPSPNQVAHESRTWEEWLAAARKASAQGDSRQAIHCAYWAGIMRLQGAGVLPADRTRTPREYLGLLTPVESTESPREPLAALTRELERFWYASRAASNEDFRESLRHLAALGCNVE
jgi:hypothetical protein